MNSHSQLHLKNGDVFAPTPERQAGWLARLLTAAVLGASAWLTPSPASAEGESPEQLQRMYENAVAQLRAAQERRNELAKENEKLTASVGDLEKRLAEARADVAAITEKTFRVRAEYGAFQDFLRHYPRIAARWRLYMRQDAAADEVLDQLNSDWPFSVGR